MITTYLIINVRGNMLSVTRRSCSDESTEWMLAEDLTGVTLVSEDTY